MQDLQAHVASRESVISSKIAFLASLPAPSISEMSIHMNNVANLGTRDSLIKFCSRVNRVTELTFFFQDTPHTPLWIVNDQQQLDKGPISMF